MTKHPVSSRSRPTTPSQKKPKSTRSTTTQTRTTTRKSRSTKEPEKPETVLPAFLKRLLEDPDAIRNLRRHLPSWADELLAVILIVSGAVAFASLLNAGGEGELASKLSTALRQGFGNGGYLVSLGVLAGGFIILLPKIGVQVAFSWGRLVSLELTFLCLQGLLHIAEFETESRALAREGQGGGYIGWAVSNLLVGAFGSQVSLIIVSIGLVLGIHWLLRIRRQHYRQIFVWLSESIQNLAAKLDPSTKSAAVENQNPPTLELESAATPEKPVEVAPVSSPVPPVESREEQSKQDDAPLPGLNRPSIVPRPNNGAAAPPTRPPAPPTSKPAPIRPPVMPVVPAITSVEGNGNDPEAQDTDEDFVSEEIERPELVVNGQVINPAQVQRERPSIVPRAPEPEKKPIVLGKMPEPKRVQGGRDGDERKRYFRVEDFKERVKIGKRDDALPPLELLGQYDLFRPDEEEINRNASIIENTLLEFDIDADVIDVKVGPVVTQYAVSPVKEILNPETNDREIKRVRVDRITNLQGDLALALSAKTLRIEAPVPGHSYVGIEVPNKNPSTVGLRSLLEAELFYNKHKNPLCIPLGRDVSGEPVIMDLASLPHLLIAGTTGSGKSVCLTSIITSLVMNNTPALVRMVMLDPKRVELTRFNGLPHLLGPVETEAERIIGVLRWTAREMDRRYKLLELENARNIESYNATLGRRRKEEHLPYIVLFFDEIGDLMMSHPDETETTVTRLAQKARAAGIHLVIATQRPSVDILTGLIKANFPGRISFAVASGTDSRVILDYTGAETLLGRGDMLYLAPDAAGPKRIQGCYISDEELEETVLYWQNWHQEQIVEGDMEIERVAPWERGITRLEALSEHDPMLEEAITLVCEAKEASTSLIQRRLGIGYPRAARLMDLLYELGIIGPPKAGGRAREVKVKNYKEALQMIKRNR
ncbi:MAG: DUF87 domain-containing protein [Anaerolineae bacterium]|nr:DUF87 domain-containing protein [Anaerolineae bacterium]